MREVESGRLDATITVDDGGEVGLLQAGFNRMVDGLRERERLRDLFGRHVGVDVAREAIERGVSLGGEIQPASVLFVDLSGSTALAQRLEPQAVVSLLNDFFNAVVHAVSAEGGWVNKFEGDAALCVFGTPVPYSDHSSRALRAALALRAAIQELATRYPGLDAGIGVSSGEVVAGNVGSEDRFEFTVIGDPVNEAARLTEAAKTDPSRLYASRRAVEVPGDEAANWRLTSERVLRGRSTPTAIYVPC
jgi:adenylate cyclase